MRLSWSKPAPILSMRLLASCPSPKISSPSSRSSSTEKASKQLALSLASLARERQWRSSSPAAVRRADPARGGACAGRTRGSSEEEARRREERRGTMRERETREREREGGARRLDVPCVHLSYSSASAPHKRPQPLLSRALSPPFLTQWPPLRGRVGHTAWTSEPQPSHAPLVRPLIAPPAFPRHRCRERRPPLRADSALIACSTYCRASRAVAAVAS
mmetsp:Transcript_5193/g.15886  ORF Transcript_5193/g.15886 Transcript_5193/m.15886 type:complete len:218 (-) Transcript_5193:1075-1728(-)